MQTAQLNINAIVLPDGKIDEAALPLLREVVERYPYYHAARMLLLRLLYQMRDSQFTDELHRAAIFLPSRARIYQEIEGENMRPRPEEMEKTVGHRINRKSPNPVEKKSPADRTGELLDIFLNATSPVAFDVRSGRPVDATVDYISWLQHEEAMAEKGTQTLPNTDNDVTGESRDQKPVSATDKIFDEFDNFGGNGRLKLSDKPDEELEKPSLIEQESGGSGGALTETLARIYIKQGKFEQAIKIIRQLSLKYPKKNRYFADQIRFLEKLIINQSAK